MDMQTLELYVDTYLNSLDDNDSDEWYGTNRARAKIITHDLMQYIEQQETIADAKHMLEQYGYEVRKK